MTITVCHYPPGTSKWNKIEHRLFSFISINWRGRPLTDIRTIIGLISATNLKRSNNSRRALSSRALLWGSSIASSSTQRA